MGVWIYWILLVVTFKYKLYKQTQIEIHPLLKRPGSWLIQRLHVESWFIRAPNEIGLPDSSPKKTPQKISTHPFETSFWPIVKEGETLSRSFSRSWPFAISAWQIIYVKVYRGPPIDTYVLYIFYLSKHHLSDDKFVSNFSLIFLRWDKKLPN